jgi:hypothetical protein
VTGNRKGKVKSYHHRGTENTEEEHNELGKRKNLTAKTRSRKGNAKKGGGDIRGSSTAGSGQGVQFAEGENPEVAKNSAEKLSIEGSP